MNGGVMKMRSTIFRAERLSNLVLSAAALKKINRRGSGAFRNGTEINQPQRPPRPPSKSKVWLCALCGLCG